VADLMQQPAGPLHTREGLQWHHIIYTAFHLGDATYTS